MSAGFDVPGAGIRSQTELGAAATPRGYGAGAGGFNRAAAGPPDQSLGGRGNKRAFTEDDDLIVRRVMRGTMSRENARLLLGCGREQLIRRMAELASIASAPPSLGRPLRPFTEQEDDLIRQAAAGTISRERARREIGCAYEPINRRCTELGLSWPRKPIPARAGDPSRPVAARTTGSRVSGARPSLQLPPAGDGRGTSSGWVVIATRAERGWRMTADAPVSPQDARKLVEQGRADTTQRRVAEGFELLFRWVRS